MKNLAHLAVSFSQPNKNTIDIELHHGARKNVATLRTVKTLINNLIIGVTLGFRYKMRYVYAHFPINVNVEKNSETDLFEVEIRCVLQTRRTVRPRTDGHASQELHRRKDRAESENVAWCDGGDLKESEG